MNKKNNNSPKKIRDFICHIIIVFITVFIDCFFLIINLLEGDITFYLVLVSALSALSNTCFAVSCTIIFIEDNKNNTSFFERKILYIIISLLVYLYTVCESIITVKQISKIVILIICLIFQIIVLCSLLKKCFLIYISDKDYKKKLNEVHNKDCDYIGDEYYNLKGKNDDDSNKGKKN